MYGNILLIKLLYIRDKLAAKRFEEIGLGSNWVKWSKLVRDHDKILWRAVHLSCGDCFLDIFLEFKSLFVISKGVV